MDKQLSPEAFNQLIEQAYPTYFLDLNQKCFTRCVRIPLGGSKKPPQPEDSEPVPLTKKLQNILKPEEPDYSRWNLTEKET